MTKRKINKLFGGTRHGLVVSLPLDQPVIEFPEVSKPYRFGDFPKASDLAYRFSRYRRRLAIFGENEVYFYAIETATDKEAFQMLCNYLLRGSEIIE